MRKIKNRKVKPGWQTTNRTTIFLSTTSSPMVVEQKRFPPRLPRPADLLHIPGGEKHFVSLENRNLKIGKANRLE